MMIVNGGDMHTNNSMEEMAEELAIARFALGQTICNLERQWGVMSLVAIAHHWKMQAAIMQDCEWHSGREGLLQYLKIQNSKSAKEAIAVLTSPEACYKRNADLYKGLYRQRKTKSDATYSRAAQQILEAYSKSVAGVGGTESHGVTTRAFNFARKYVRAWKSKVSGRRNG